MYKPKYIESIKKISRKIASQISPQCQILISALFPSLPINSAGAALSMYGVHAIFFTSAQRVLSYHLREAAKSYFF